MTRLCYTILVVASFITLSCEKECECANNSLINACSAEDPINDTQWLVDLKHSITNCSCQVSIMKGTYLGYKTVFYSIMNDPLCNGYREILLLDCYGEVIKVFEDVSEFGEQVSHSTPLYTCKN